MIFKLLNRLCENIELSCLIAPGAYRGVYGDHRGVKLRRELNIPGSVRLAMGVYLDPFPKTKHHGELFLSIRRWCFGFKLEAVKDIKKKESHDDFFFIKRKQILMVFHFFANGIWWLTRTNP